MLDNYLNLENLSDEQKRVVESDKNIILTACPGSGKTRTLTYRLAYQTVNSPLSNKLNIAITFTNRAANEIENRLIDMGIESSNVWTGTIHQFCMRYIIQPYSMYSKRLFKGYTIIDEYVKDKYINGIKEELGIKIDYYENPLTNCHILKAYNEKLRKNKEIDFDMILKYSNLLLEENSFISENIASLINCIFVDEFQDTNELQYLILSKIFKANKSIIIMFVGDINQAIYGTLGGCAKSKSELDILYDTDFSEMSLTGCYRSTQRIVNLYKRFEIKETGVVSVSNIKNEEGIAKYNYKISKDDLINKIATIIKTELANGIKAEDICILEPQWYGLFNLSKQLRSLLPDVSFDSPDISPIKYDPLNPFYLIAQLLFMPKGEKTYLKKKIANELISIFKNEFNLVISENIINYDIITAINCCRNIDSDGINCFRAAISSVFSLLEIDIQSEDSLSNMQIHYFEKINDRIEKYQLEKSYESISKYFCERQGIVISTIHGIKGEEYHTVIAFDLLNGKLPNWNIICNHDSTFRQIEANKLLYVLCSRAKKNIYLFSETGRTTKKGVKLTPTDELIRLIRH